MSAREEIYGGIVDYFGDISMKLVKNEGGWAIYGAKITTSLNLSRYIFAIVPGKPFLPNETTLDAIDWVSFQTRTTDQTYSVPSHSIYPTDKNRASLLDLITVIDRNREETIYRTSNLPIKIKLLHDPKKNNYLQYPDQAKLYQALETYRCVIELL